MFKRQYNLTNDRGDALVGYQVRVATVDPEVTVDIFADESGTPISSVSGIANIAITDLAGNFEFWVEPGIYTELYSTPQGVFLARNRAVPMQSGPQGEKGDTGGPRALTTLADLKAALTGDDTFIYDSAPFKWTTGNYTGQADDINIVQSDFFPLSTGAWVRQGADKVAAKLDAAETVVQTQAAVNAESVSPERFGAIPGLLADPTANTEAFTKAIDYCADTGATLRLNGRTYRLDASDEASGGVNFGKPRLTVIGGGATLQYVGEGRAFVIDPDPTNTFFGTTLYGVNISDVLIVGNPDVTDGFYARGLCHAIIAQIEVREVSEKAFHIKHAVSSQFDTIRYSTNSTPGEPPQTTQPLVGLYLDNNDGVDPGPIPRTGYYTADCTFNNPIMEGFDGTGVELADAQGNLFNCGTSEANAKGLVIRAPCINNQFNTFWSEQNSVTDIEDAGDDTFYAGVRMISNAPSQNVILTGDGATFVGGRVRSVQFSGGPKNASFYGVSLSSNVSLGFQGTATYTRIGCKKFDVDGNIVGTFEDILGGQGSVTVTLAPSTSGTISLNASFNTLYWTVVGNRVEYNGLLLVSGVSSPVGQLRLSGLAHAPASVGNNRTAGTVAGRTLVNPQALEMIIQPGISYVSIETAGGGDMADDVQANSEFFISFSFPISL